MQELELPVIDGKVQLYQHQVDAIDKLHNGSILWSRPGNGKSLTAVAYYYSKVCKGVYHDLSSMREPRDLYIITTAKKRDTGDWERDAANFCITGERDASVAGVKLTVDSWNNIGKYKEVKDAFFIFDEQRIVGSGEWTKSFIHIAKSNQWILLTATPGDTWLDYIPVFVANGFYKNRTEFKRRHVVYNTFAKFPKVDHYVDVGHLVRLRNSILVHMPYRSHTVRHSKYVVVDHDKDLFKKAVEERWNVFENRPLKDVGELFRVMRKIVNSDSSRLQAVRTLLDTHPKLIVFYNFDYELEMLRTLGSPPTQSTDGFDGTEMRGDQSKSTSRTKSESTSKKGLSESSVDGCSKEKTSKTSAISSVSSRGRRTESNSGSTVSSSSPKCGKRAPYMNGHTGICQLPPHGPEQPHLVEMVTVDTNATDYGSMSERSAAEKSRTSSTRRLQTGSGSGSGLTADSERRRSSTSTRLLSPVDPATAGKSTTGPPSSKTAQLYPEESVAVAEWNGHKHQPIPQTERWLYLVQYVAGAEGWNCTETDAMVFYSLTYSYKVFHQAHGRIDRLNTEFQDLYYYILISQSMIDGAIMKSLKNKKNFNESDYGSKF